MSEVIKLDSDEWEISVDALKEPLRKKIQFAGSPIVFFVTGEYVGTDHRSFNLALAPVKNVQINQMKYLVEYQVDFSAGWKSAGAFKENYDRMASLFAPNVSDRKVSIKLTLKKLAPFYGVNADLDTYIGRGATVTLVGSDGTVSVSRRLIRMWSKVLEAMFNHDSQEKRTGEIKMEDFDSATLAAFKLFLMTGVIENGKQTALGLILLADKYDMQVMKQAAEEYVKQNIREMDEQEVFDVFLKVSRDTLVDSMVDFWSKK